MAATSQLTFLQKRKEFPENCPPFCYGTFPEAELPLKRLRLDEPPTNVQLSGALGQHGTPAPTLKVHAFATAGVPALSPQQRLPTIPEIHTDMEQGHHAAAQQQWAQPLSPPSPLPQQEPQPLGRPQAQQQQMQLLGKRRAPEQSTEPVPEQPLHTAGGVGAEEGESGEDKEADGASPPQQHRRRVGEEAYRLVIPDHLTAIPAAVLSPAFEPPFPAVSPSAGDSMAVVPYVPQQAVVQDACLRALHQRRPQSPLEAWCHQSGLKFDNELPLPDLGQTTSAGAGGAGAGRAPRVLIEELDGEPQEAAEAPMALESDGSAAMEE